MGKDKQKIDFFKTAKGISQQLREDPALKIYKDTEQGIDVTIVNLSDDGKDDKSKIMSFIKKNKGLPDSQKKALFVYDGFSPDSKLIKPSKVMLKKTKNILTVNDLKLVN